MIQKYKLVKEHYADPNGDIKCTMMPEPLGEYVQYSDFVKETETLRDYNFKLQEQCVELSQTKEDLINVIVGLNNTLSKKESELTNVTDRLNNICVRAKPSLFFTDTVDYISTCTTGDNHIRSRLL